MYFSAVSLLLATVPVTVLAQTACTGVVGAAASQLKGYAPAQAYCSARYPVPTVTVTVAARGARRRTFPTTRSLSTTTTTSRTTISLNAQQSKLSSILGVAAGSFCTCIETPKTTTVVAGPALTCGVHGDGDGSDFESTGCGGADDPVCQPAGCKAFCLNANPAVKAFSREDTGCFCYYDPVDQVYTPRAASSETVYDIRCQV